MGEQRAPRPAGNLPIIPSRFVGRHRELTEVKQQMETSRLITLTGPGGVGKTRLAIQAGQLAKRAFSDGAWLVDLAAVDDADRTADAVAAALGIRDHSARPASEQLADYLTSRRLLVIMDNCEHLITACACLVDRLLGQAPGLHVLATSRQPLRISGERMLVVDPMPVPSGEVAPSADVLAKYESVMLLVDRATAVQPGFRVHEGNREPVARLCARLDGLPLAIELAATRLRSLSIEQVADRIEDRFRLLSRGSPAARSRQQTLRALMDWSYDLCSEQERRLWASLSVFPGKFDLEAAESICAGPGTGIEPDAILDVLDNLVAKSVVTVSLDSPRARYRLLETIRRYGREVLTDAALEGELRRRHRDYYLRLAVRSCETWCGPGQPETLTMLRLERDNMATALEWSLAEPGELPSALLLVSALRYHWTLGGHLAAGRRWIDQVLGAASGPTPERGHALWVGAWVALLQGDSRAADGWLRECQAIASLKNDDHLRAYVLVLSGTQALFAGQAAQAARHFAAGIGLMRAQGDPAAVLWALFQDAVALSHSGDSDAAQEACAEAIHLAGERGEIWARAEAMWASGFDQWVAGDREGTAATLVREALVLTPNANDVSIVLGIELLAWIEGSRANHPEAARLLGAATALWNSLGTTIAAFGPIFSRYSLACRTTAASELGDARFRALLEEGSADPQRVLWVPGRPESPVRLLSPADLPALTKRERDVARLIAKGLTNKAIAGELVLSPRTVDGHIARLFAKIGVTTRAQAAVWMSEHEGLA